MTAGGVVLVMVLIVLLVMTLVSVTTLNTSSMQTFIARNTFFQQIAFHNAESSVRTAELTWNAAVDACLNDIAACTMDVTPPLIEQVDGFDWDALSDATEVGDDAVVEYLGWRPIAGDSDQRVLLYRFTARGLGPNGGAVSYIQTLYRKCIKKDGAPCSRS